ncbi:MAG: glycerol-3-phosphate dehydrogenase/oxidase [Saprospiraceae bacterium]|nr:glycerol-3-phosphate dehydrogenase/oxidase [Saprospiraceae bacterium]
MADRLSFSKDNREAFFSKAEKDTYDLLIIGGGITGAGIALDAISRGLSVCLVEKNDFASGTSSKSTKLIHGGLRYLKQFEFNLVKEVGRERAVLHRLARHIVVPEKMVLPLIQGGSLGKIMTSLGLYIYDFLADVDDDDKRRMLAKEEVLAIEPLLPTSKLLGGSIYAEYRTDDARLTMEVLKTAHRYGANLLNYVECKEIAEINGIAASIICIDTLSGREIKIKSLNIVNATGPWVDEVRSLSETIQGKRLYLTKGVHIVVAKDKLPVRHATYFDVPHDDRMIFAIPRLNVTYIGTTDTYYEGDKDDVAVTQHDVQYLLSAVNQTFDIEQLTEGDIISSWAGIRPLIYEDGKSASEISRKDEIFEAENGLLSIAGGKLTGYRKMAERIVDMVVERLHPNQSNGFQCKTEDICLTDPSFTDAGEYRKYADELSKRCQELSLIGPYDAYLLQNYGPSALVVLEAAEKYLSTYPIAKALILAELDYCADHEMINLPLDFLERRTGRLFFMPETIKLVENLIFQYFESRFDFDKQTLENEKERWDNRISSILIFD